MELGQTNYVFYARNGMECRMWMDALKEGAQFRIDRFYEIGELIGSGGCAEVHAAYDRETGAKAAVKTIKKGSETDAFLQREITILRRLNHPNVVRTLDIFESSEAYQVVMEFVDGGHLQDKMSATNEFSEDEVRHLMGQMLQALANIHSTGIVHRDLKPENVLLTSDGTVKIADFGLSRLYDAWSDGLMRTLVGTPEFMAPELVRNEKYGIEVDAWACGIIMFCLTTGTPPFSYRTVLQNYRKNLVLINWQRPGWRSFSEQAKDLNRMLLCVDPSHRVNPLGALNHRWFTDREDQAEAGKQRQERRGVGAHSVVLNSPTNPNPYRAESVGCYENTDTTWDYIVEDLSWGDMDSVSYSPAPSPRNRNRKPTMAESESTGSMAPLVTSAQTSDSAASSMPVKRTVNNKAQVAVSSFVHSTGGALPTRIVLSSVSPLCRNVRPEHIRPLRINPHSSVGVRLQMDRDRAGEMARHPGPTGHDAAAK